MLTCTGDWLRVRVRLPLFLHKKQLKLKKKLLCPCADVSVWLPSPFAWCSRTNFLPLIDWLVDASQDFFFQVDLCSVCFKDALWCVHPNGEVFHDARTLLQVLRHLRLLSRSVLWTWWDRHTHAKHAALALNPVTPFNWIPPLYGRPLATTFDLYSPLTPASPYHRWQRQILFVLWNLC